MTTRKTYCKTLPNGDILTAEVRFDDECRNGHRTLSITGELRAPRERNPFAGGCMHEELAEHFPELRPLIPYHLCSEDGPLHYLANTIYFAGDRDHHGKRKGKPRELDLARAAAIWPDATDEDLCQEPEALKAALLARLPALLADFREKVTAIGLDW